MSDTRLVGQRTPRQDAQAKAEGSYVYGMDFHLDGELHGAILRSPHAHARIRSIDTSRARSLPGVEAVLSAADLPAGLLMPGMVWDQPLLAGDRVRYHGEPVAAVAAQTPAIARQALEAIVVDYEPLPPVLDAEAAMAPETALVHDAWESYRAEEGLVRHGNVCCHASLRVGDVERAFGECDAVVEGTYTTLSVHQSHVEPRVATGLVLPGQIPTVYSNTQLPYWIRTNVAHVLDVEEDKVRIVTTGIGGAFGSKLYPQIEPLTALLSQRAKKPVRLMVPLTDELIAGLPRHPTKTHIKSGVRRDGTLLALQATMIMDGGAYAGSTPEIASVAVLCLAGPYRTPNVSVDVFGVLTHKTNFGAYRGPGGPQSVFALETHLDEVAAAIGMDPLDLRLHNILEEGDIAPNGQVVTGVGLRDAVERAAQAIEWRRPAGPNRGKGLSLGWWTTTLQLSTAEALVDDDGQIVVRVGTQEIGTGAIMGGVRQVAAETLGVNADEVTVEVHDTLSGLWDWGSQGSRTVSNVGRAAQLACVELRQQILSLAEKLLETAQENLQLAPGRVFVKDSPEDHLALRDLAQRAPPGRLFSHAESNPEPTRYDKARLTSCFYPAFHHPSFHCHAAEVEVDPGTGVVRVRRYAAAHDIGAAINPMLIEGQIEGGVMQGLGMALMEELLYDEHGRRTNINWTDYKLPTLADVPEIQPIIIEHPSTVGPYGSKGLGESPVIHPPAAIANAVAQATGLRFRSLPITPEKVALALRSSAR
ncbi:MAG TPA: xanthine dehydrogenase family protein molybdopterin-binding subunit [Anaerolineales bacterium]|nr:xanthine dehydrogenase family protein molybdopterin-binding subunit [Anaerolineales bacterium]